MPYSSSLVDPIEILYVLFLHDFFFIFSHSKCISLIDGERTRREQSNELNVRILFLSLTGIQVHRHSENNGNSSK